MGKAKLGSWWAAGAAVCMLVSAGVARAAPVVAEAPVAPVTVSRHDERGGGDQTTLMALHRQNQQTIVDAEIAQNRGTTTGVRDFAASVIVNCATSDAKLMNYAHQQGMNVDEIRLAAGALPNGALTRVDLVDSPPDRFDADFAAKMVANAQAAVDQTQKAQALARAPGMAPLLQEIAPILLQQQADAMSLVAALPTPPTRAMPFGPPSGLGQAPTGLDTNRGVAR
jgi:predicted outer membrane protein